MASGVEDSVRGVEIDVLAGKALIWGRKRREVIEGSICKGKEVIRREGSCADAL
jgi:hypothetical protein